MDEVIPVATRMKWVEEEYPNAYITTQPQPLPQNPSETSLFWEIWRSCLLSLLPEKIDAVFASETYGERLATELSAEFIMVDNQRLQVPVSATIIRNDAISNWNFLAPSVQRYWQKTICIFGPESTGKSTLTQQLAQHYQMPCVMEYAQEVIINKNGDIVFNDMEIIVKGHYQRLVEAQQTLAPLVFVDTDALTSKIWSNELFGSESSLIEEIIAKQKIDHYLLLDIDIPWVDDIHRYRPKYRNNFFERCEKELLTRHLPYTIIRGTGIKRLENAIHIIDSLLKGNDPLNYRANESRSELAHILLNEEEEDKVSGG